MIYYMNISLPKKELFWRPVPDNFNPVDVKSPKLWIRIGDTIYCEWSEAFEAAVMWHELTA